MFSRKFFSGTSSKKDHRFDEKSQVKKINFSKKIGESLLIDHVNSNIFSQWVSKEMQKYTDDDFVCDLVLGFLDNDTINSQEFGQQLRSMIGEENAISFVETIWPLLIEAQNSDTGMPQVIVEETKSRIEKTMKRNQLLLQRIKEEEELAKKLNIDEQQEEKEDESDDDTIKAPPPAHSYNDDSSDDSNRDSKRTSRHYHTHRHKRRKHHHHVKEENSPYSSSSSEGV